MKHKSTRISSFLLAVVLALTLVFGTGMQAFAEEPQIDPDLGPTVIVGDDDPEQKDDDIKTDSGVLQQDVAVKKDNDPQPGGDVIPQSGAVAGDDDTAQDGDALPGAGIAGQGAAQSNDIVDVPPPPEANGLGGGIAAAPAAAPRGYHLEPATVPAGTKGVAYRQAISLYNEYDLFGIRNDEKTVDRWAVAGTLPNGITFNNGVFSGTPTQAGTFTFTITATHINAIIPFVHSATQTYTITINEGPNITTTTLANGIKGVAYAGATLAATGTAPITWSATGLPAGLTLSAAGVLSGTPTVSGNFTVKVTASNAAGTTGPKSFTMVVYEKPAITTASLPNGTQNSSYSQTLRATGTTPLTWRVASGSLPNGLSLNASSGVISGRPSVAGKFIFTIEAANTLLGSKYTDTKEYTVEIWLAPGITTKNPPFGVVGKEYNYQLAATGYPQDFKWEITAGSSLPRGLTLNRDTGLISGIPAETGITLFGVKVTNSKGSDIYLLYSITVYPMPKITTGRLGNSAVGILYTDAVQVEAASITAGAPTWSLAEGSVLPGGLSLNKETGIIYGRPADGTAGEYAVTIVVTNRAGSDSKTYTFSVYEGPAITTQTIEPCVVGTAYSQTLAATGHPAAVWSVVGGALPDGLTLNTDGTITGTPAEGAEGDYSVIVRAESTYTYSYAIDLKIFQKTETKSDTKTYSFSVYLTPSITDTDLDDAIQDEEYSAVLEAAAYPEATWALYEPVLRAQTTDFTGLPAGLTLSADGTITGAATGAAGTYSFWVVASNAGGTSQPVEFSITVNDKPVITTSALANALVGSEYGTLLLEGISSTPITWSVEGSLPAGISLTDGAFSGTPTKGGTYEFTIIATNITGSKFSAKTPFTLVVNEKPTITTEYIYSEYVDVPYSFTLEATGDADITWALAEGSQLPPGLTLNSNGIVTGTPTTMGQYTFSVVATNGFGTFTKEFTMFVNPPLIPGNRPGEEEPPVNQDPAPAPTPAPANPVKTTARSPKTGDTGNIFLVMTLLVLSFTAVLVSSYIFKKRSQNK